MSETAAISGSGAVPAGPRGGAEAGFRDFVALMKPRVMSLVVFTALAGLVAAPGGVEGGVEGGVHPVVGLATILCIAAGAGASGALNMWWDADIDAVMRRTCARPVPSGVVTPGEALGFGLGLALLSVMVLAVVANPLAAGLLALTIFYYAVIYTMWLKRTTPQNIVIGGAAGAFPPVIAWAAATGGVSAAPLLMFLVIFLWTPPHFWALALFRNEDYRAAGVPMLPVVAGEAATRRQVWLYALALAPVSLAPAVTEAGGPVYLGVALVANAALLRAAWPVARRRPEAAASDRYRAEKRLFGVSILYLFALFGGFIGDAALEAVAGGLGWPAPRWPVWF